MGKSVSKREAKRRASERNLSDLYHQLVQAGLDGELCQQRICQTIFGPRDELRRRQNRPA
jgi:hypothetical protein